MQESESSNDVISNSRTVTGDLFNAVLLLKDLNTFPPTLSVRAAD